MANTKFFLHIFVSLMFLSSIAFLTSIPNASCHLNTDNNSLTVIDYFSSVTLQEDYGDSSAGFDIIISSADSISVGRSVEFTISFTTTSFSTHTGTFGDVYIVIGAQISSATVTYQFKTSSFNYISGASETVPVSDLTFNSISQIKDTSKTISIPTDQSIAFLTITISFSGSLHQTKNDEDRGWLSASGLSSEVNIPVSIDEAAPILDSPPDIQYTEGTTGHNISWTATDDFPERYTIYRNGSSVATDSWISGTSITINIDYLTMGTYNYTILVSDEYDNSAKDIVIVTVTAIPQTSPSFEFWLFSLMVPIIVFFKNRREK